MLGIKKKIVALLKVEIEHNNVGAGIGNGTGKIRMTCPTVRINHVHQTDCKLYLWCELEVFQLIVNAKTKLKVKVSPFEFQILI